MAWALYLVLALSAFALHVHSPAESGHAPCALCLAQNVVSAVGVVAGCVFVAPTLRWEWQIWLAFIGTFVVAAIARQDEARGPPVLFEI